MRIAGLIVGGILSGVGGLCLIGPLWNAIRIYAFSDEMPGAGSTVGPIVLAAAPLVVGLILLSKCQKKPDDKRPNAPTP